MSSLAAHERGRQARLLPYETHDPADQIELDALTRAAAEALDAPSAFLAFGDERRQRCRAAYGIDLTTQTQPEITLCAAVIEQNAPVYVEDTQLDARYANHPSVAREPAVRFFAGVPVSAPDGFVLGALCVIDLEPRVIARERRSLLDAMARHAGLLLETIRKSALLREQKHVLGAYARFFELSVDLLCTTDSQWRPRRLNSAWIRTLGWPLEKLRAGSLLDIAHEADLALATEQATKLLQEEIHAASFELRLRHQAGHWVPFGWTLRAVDGTLFGSARDLTERKTREAALAEREAHLRAVFDGMVEGAALTMANGETVAWNSAAERLLGLSAEQISGRAPEDPAWRTVREDGSPLSLEDYPERLALRTGQRLNDAVVGVHKPNGQLSWLAFNARPVRRPGESLPYGVVTTFRDITEQRAAAERRQRLARQERLVTTGTLAAGVGHEINNPLSYVLGNIEFAMEELHAIAGGSPSGRLRSLISILGEARMGADQIRKIVRGLRSLAREEGQALPVEIHSAVEVALHMAMHELRRRASVSIELPSLPRVLADEARLTQVFVNLLVNAAQAFKTDDPAHNSVVVTGNVAGDSVVVRVVDNGPGIAHDVQAHIFDPFFTTKPLGEGTGLGLSISHSIVEGLEGELRCESEPGKGCTFVLRLPIAHGGGLQDPITTAPAAATRARVMVIDDDAAVLRVLTRILERDFEIVGCSDSRDGLKRLQGDDAFAAIVCDLTMAFLSGADVYKQAVAHRPELAERFVFMTGGALRQDLEAFVNQVSNVCLDKPLNSDLLRSTVKQLVERASIRAA